ncbi:CLUMA_CG012937, isoform A [Clunio marinus]|uniref:CLUMA_CG012937, isoform A n=1 Tax=Clunio marinus TaxID=568069 RepID=A0A1J1IMD1_9DIPT|nr:CLUMA_CG012937, isoform A [Clunio marinus]
MLSFLGQIINLLIVLKVLTTIPHPLIVPIVPGVNQKPIGMMSSSHAEMFCKGFLPCQEKHCFQNNELLLAPMKWEVKRRVF